MSIPEKTCGYRYGQTGISLIELIMFIVIVSVGLAGILSVMNVTTKNSADPMLRKQAIALAESLMEEIQLQSFTYCDPDDPNPLAAAALNIAGCTANFVEILGQEPAQGGEARSTAPFFDNVSDYHNFSMPVNEVQDIEGNLIAGLGPYSVSVRIAEVGALPAFGLPNQDVLRIDVTVQSGANLDITLTGYRFRYAP
jgi:MSHA pilin protein MshD